MRDAIGAVACVGVLVMLSVTPAAQWPSYQTAGLPRLPDGTVDMEAPTPRTPDGRPDLSGVWENVGRGQGQGREAVGPDEVPFATFFDVGAGFRDGLPLQPWAAALKAQRMADNSKDNPDAWCLPLGNMQFNVHPFPRKIIQAPHVVLILYETHQGYRQIFLDGRPLPPAEDEPQPWWFGYSVGRWEDDTLVVETTHFRDGEWLDIAGSPLTDAARTVERFRRVNVGQLDLEVTFDDPKAYTRPFTVRLRQRLMPDTDIIEMVCAENNRFPQHVSD
jgi:hypothetical protein